jgi:hypothetical protein
MKAPNSGTITLKLLFNSATMFLSISLISMINKDLERNI